VQWLPETGRSPPAIHVGYGESEIPSLVKEINGLWTQSSGPAIALETTPESRAAIQPKTGSE
jgi:hypothetical protein